jgi:hypothetical protein
MGTQWIIPLLGLHLLYIAVLVAFTGAIRHIKFRFRELKDLWRGILVSSSAIVIWIVSYVLNETHEEIEWLQVVSRFLLLFTASILVLGFFSLSSSQPLMTIMSLKKVEEDEGLKTMGQALGLHDDRELGLETTLPISPNTPLDKLLQDKLFRQSFMEFADSCMAGESVHFYDEVQQLDNVPADDVVRRIYMARHIIERYINPGASMEVNISHRSRQDILTTLDLSQPGLFNNTLNELMHLMKMNLVNDYWSSMFFAKLKETASLKRRRHEADDTSDWNFSPRLSSVHCADDPFQQQHLQTD